MTMACSICSAHPHTIKFQDSLEAKEWQWKQTHYQYRACNQCGFLQALPIPGAQDLAEFYQTTYPYDWFARNDHYKKIQARHRAFKIRKYLQNHLRVLDFGCGHGYFVAALVNKGIDAQGFDLGAEKISQENNARITLKNNFSAFSGQGFDLITLWHVLEHMPNHDETLAQLIHRLQPNGKLIIAVPNTNSWGYKWLGTKWGWLQQPYVHINQYNPTNLSRLLQNHGLTILSVSTTDTWDQNWYDVCISWLFYKNKSRNTVRHFDAGTGGSLLFKANQWVRLLFTLPSYFVSWLFQHQKAGAELMVVAQKSPH